MGYFLNLTDEDVHFPSAWHLNIVHQTTTVYCPQGTNLWGCGWTSLHWLEKQKHKNLYILNDLLSWWYCKTSDIHVLTVLVCATYILTLYYILCVLKGLYTNFLKVLRRDSGSVRMKWKMLHTSSRSFILFAVWKNNTDTGQFSLLQRNSIHINIYTIQMHHFVPEVPEVPEG